MLNDSHCHFFSSQFFSTLSRQRGRNDTVEALCRELQWDDPGTPDALADRWVQELDAHGVARSALIASVPGDEASVAAAVSRHPGRFVGFFMDAVAGCFPFAGPDDFWKRWRSVLTIPVTCCKILRNILAPSHVWLRHLFPLDSHT